MSRHLTEYDREQVSQSIKHSRLIEASRKLARIVKHVDPEPKVKAARTRIEKSLSHWLRHHGGEAFSSKWSPDHIRVLGKIETAINSGGLFALAMPRGHGKTTILKWITLYVLLTGRRKYVVIVAATAELAQVIIEFCRQQIIESDTLHEHYPHVTTYARATGGKAIKAIYQLRADGKTSGIKWSKTTLVLPEVTSTDGEGYPSNGAILEGHGLTGAIRGKWRDTKTGKVLRPDFVIADDPQSRESSESSSQCAMRERIITGDVLGLAGPRKKIAAVMPCTIIRRGDLADRFLDHSVHPEWQGEICQLVKKWPDAQDTLWKQYTEIYREDGGMAKATDFYLANRAKMDAGAEVSWEERIRDGEVSAIQTAENLLLETGPQFWAEYQNEPLSLSAGQYEITPELVIAHTINLPRLQLPPTSTVFVGHIDINRTGLHWAVAGFDQSMTGHCPAYGRWPSHGDLWPKNAQELVRKQAIFRGLKDLCDRISQTVFLRDGKQVRLGLLLVDRGYEPDVVHKFAAVSVYPFRVLPARGYAAQQYFPRKNMLIGRPMEGCHVTKSDNGPFLAFNADMWRETAQRAFLPEAGAHGGFTIYHSASDREHSDFAEHVAAEKLTNKYETDKGTRWEWSHQPGAAWDWGDAVTGCWVAAAASGLSPSGMKIVRRVYQEKRKAKVLVEE
ncbi:MAG: hypothetical protein ABFD59_08370 [Smithella sp.]